MDGMHRPVLQATRMSLKNYFNFINISDWQNPINYQSNTTYILTITVVDILVGLG